MISISVDTGDLGRLAALMRTMGSAGRAQLNRVGANAAAAHVQRHIRGYAMGKHFTATSLGAAPTGHYERGAAAITSSSSSDSAEVRIPIPGISRAYHDISITTPTKNGRNYVTIPRHRAAYGQTVEKLRTRGWRIFRPGKKRILLGYRQKGEKPVILFTLAESVRQPRDARLLPTKAELGRAFTTAQKLEINRVLRRAGRT